MITNLFRILVYDHHLGKRLPVGHAADEARMRILLHGLQNTKFYKELDSIASEWKKLKEFWSEPLPEYQYAYPDGLLKGITEIFLKDRNY